MEKRTVSIGVKMTPDDWRSLTMAAERLWPGAMLSRSSVLLSLAKRGAESVKPSRSGKKS